MGKIKLVLSIFLLLSSTVMGKSIRAEIVPERTMSFLFTPVVIPDVIGFKSGFEYRLHKNFNVVVPLEFKFMNYGWIFNKMIDRKALANAPVRLLWSHDLQQFKLSSGIGLKWMPFSESMQSGFFIKSLIMSGYEFQKDKHESAHGAVFTHVLLLGYSWVLDSGFMMAVEGGEEYTWHTNPVRGFPDLLVNGLMPVLHFSLGFSI